MASMDANEHCTGADAPARDSRRQRIDDQRREHVHRGLPSDCNRRREVERRRQMQPSLIGVQVGDAADPEPARACTAKPGLGIAATSPAIVIRLYALDCTAHNPSSRIMSATVPTLASTTPRFG